jgi:hypothetical protein
MVVLVITGVCHNYSQLPMKMTVDESKNDFSRLASTKDMLFEVREIGGKRAR